MLKSAEIKLTQEATDSLSDEDMNGRSSLGRTGAAKQQGCPRLMMNSDAARGRLTRMPVRVSNNESARQRAGRPPPPSPPPELSSCCFIGIARLFCQI